jgi:hypothetical protein
MLVVADQDAARIGRQGRLAGARQAEEDGRIIVRRGVHRAVHRHDILGRQVIVECREDRLLGLAGIGGAADQDHALGKVDRDHGFGAAAMARRIGAEARAVDDGELRLEVLVLAGFRNPQQVADEERVPGEFGDHGHRQAVGQVSAAEQFLCEHVLSWRGGF